MESGSHAAARKHGLRTPHTDALVLRGIPVFDPSLPGQTAFQTASNKAIEAVAKA
jgi:hypothetical protein